MLKSSEKKLINRLKLKKFRDQENLFVVEGVKMVQEAIDSGFAVQAIYVQKEGLISGLIPATLITEQEMKTVTHFSTPSPALALVKKAVTSCIQAIPEIDTSQLYLGLDAIRDPGNMGTIVRIADWFGIKAIFASFDSVDLYNSKVIQASMGAIFRVPVYYVELSEVIDSLQIPVWGTALCGTSIYETQLSSNGIIIIGNESNGISQKLRIKIDKMLLIPSFQNNLVVSESLNVSIATAIVCSEFRRCYYSNIYR